MDSLSKQQALDLIHKAKYIGVVVPENPDLDQFVSAQILGRVLDSSLKKSWGFVFSGETPENWKPLLENSLEPKIQNEIIISIDTPASSLEEIKYEKGDKKIEIILLPQKNSLLKKESVSVGEREKQFDLLVSIGVKNLDKIGRVFENNPHLFFNTPLINIDCEVGNDNFGEVNLLSNEVYSNSQIIFNLIRELSPQPPDENMATLILLGLATKTGNFKKPMDPKTNELVSEMKARGANLQIIKNLINQTKPLNLLKLWGRASVRSKEEGGIFWSFLTAEDFEKTSTVPENIKFVVEQFENSFPLPRLAVFLWQHPELKTVGAMLRSESPEALQPIKKIVGGSLEGKTLNVDITFADFREAETRINSLLDREG